MKKPFLIALALAAAPFAAQAETWNIYGWQNHSWEHVDIDGDRSFDRIQSNAGNIGFAASVDTGMEGIHVNVQCEQFMYVNHFAGGTGWCNRNSKIGLSHPQMGEIMLATWLLPYNEGVAQWVDPFYDAGADSHTSIMGSVGAHTIFYNTGDFDQQASASKPDTGFSGAEFNYAGGGYDTGFNRRQENIIQYWSPNWNGFVFRFAWTAGNRDETDAPHGGGDIDPVIRSSSLAYTNGPLWLAVTWQDHEDWTAVSVGEMNGSDAESFRIAGRYIMDLGDGMSVQLSAMWEDLEYEFNGVSSIAKAMSAFGYGKFGETGNLMVSAGDIDAQKTIGLMKELFPKCWDKDNAGTAGTDANGCPNTFMDTATLPDFVPATMDNPATEKDESKGDDAAGNAGVSVADADGESGAADTLKLAVDKLKTAAMAGGASDDVKHQYKTLTDKAKANAIAAKGAGQNVKIERDAWMVSGKLKFGGPLDFRFSYMDADDLEVSCGACSGDWSETAANAWNVGLFYTMPGGTELRLTYSEVDNDDNGTYGQGISGTKLGTPGTEIEMFAVGIVHWFD
jgi:predicted porin